MAKTIIEELVGVVGLEIDEAGFKKAAKNMENLKQSYARVSKAAKMFSVAAAAAVGLVTVTNKITAENQRMAEAVGISTEALAAYGSIAKQAGLNTDNVVDLVEELNNKMGESKGIEEVTAVKEAMAILGLEYEKINKLKPEEQFFRVLEAAQQLDDQQAASSAADILMGGEANKFIGLLRTQDKGLQQLISDHSALNLLTEEGGDLAVEYNKAFGKLTTVLGSATKQLSALLGKGLTPIINGFTDWVAKNKELSKTVIQVFSVVLPAAFAIAGVAIAGLTVHLIGMGLAVLGITWPIIAIAAGIGLVIAAMVLWFNDIKTFLTYGEAAKTVTGAFVGKIKDLWGAFKTLASTGVGVIFQRIAEKINMAANAAQRLTGFLGGIGSTIGGGIFDAVSAVQDFEMPDVGFGFGGGGSGGSTSNTTNNGGNTVNLNASSMGESEVKAIATELNNGNNAIAANNNGAGDKR
tara:strand:+ start:950 stop:2350 length:1401 start_codon:yes stop_codon:yes gene_type:complete